MTEAQFWIGVHGAIVDRARLLILRRAPAMAYCPGHWDLPGGHLALHEDVHECLLREIDEETGLAVEIGPMAGMNKMPGGPYVQIIYFCRLRGDRASVRLRPSEHDHARWVTLDELRAVTPLIPYLEAILRRGLLDGFGRGG
jgi:8-oxo-dGTP pyrophosphatase MutT (NUDIX family)